MPKELKEQKGEMLDLLPAEDSVGTEMAICEDGIAGGIRVVIIRDEMEVEWARIRIMILEDGVKGEGVGMRGRL